MLEPITRIAFSVVENPGVYALLLGSGISRAAEIPTGWDITLDLVRRVAAAEGVTEAADWSAWHVERFGTEPGYSALLDALSSSPAERRSILHSYIEPSEEDVEAKRRAPTRAHRAIANLVRNGSIRVIVTTNFDRLLETALSEVGVQPVVIRSVDDLAGASPLPHCQCFILKLHGDYLDNRILNIDAELAAYPPDYDRLLDRILDEYGLIVAGWSGDWDPALRAAVTRAPNRRYPLWWATRGAPSTAAQALIAQRAGILVPIESADSFFARLADAIDVLARTRRPSPDTLELLLASAKRNLARPEARIELADLFSAQTDGLIERITGPDYPVHGNSTQGTVLVRWQAMEGLGEPLARISALAGRWGGGDEFGLVLDSVKSIVAARQSAGVTLYLALASYPAYLCVLTYALGLAKAERWAELLRWFRSEIVYSYRRPETLVRQMFMQAWGDFRYDNWKIWPGLENNYTPWADHLAATVIPWGRDIGLSETNARDNLHLVELLGGLAFLGEESTESLAGRTEALYMPYGQTMWMRERDDQLFERLGLIRHREALLKAGFCRGSQEHWDASLRVINLVAARVSW